MSARVGDTTPYYHVPDAKTIKRIKSLLRELLEAYAQCMHIEYLKRLEEQQQCRRLRNS